MWSVMGVKPKYTHTDDIINKKYYFYDGELYYYPLSVTSDDPSSGQQNIYIGFQDNKYIISSSQTEGLVMYGSNDGNEDKPPREYMNCLSLIDLPLIVPRSTTENYTYPDFQFEIIVYLNMKPGRTVLDVYKSGVLFFTSFSANEHHPITQPTAPCLFFNPYQSVINSTFHITQADGGVSFTHNTASMSSYTEYNYITHEFMAKKNGSADVFTLSTEKNIDTVNIYAGVPYTLSYPDSSRSIQNPAIKIPNVGTQKLADDFLSCIGLNSPNSNYGSNPTIPWGYMLNVKEQNQANINTDPALPLPGNTTTVFYFVPHHMYHIGHGSRLEYTLYTPLDILTSWIYDIQLVGIRNSIAGTGPYTHPQITGPTADPKTLAFATTSHEATHGIVTRYCDQNEHCGHCRGVAENVNERGSSCVLDSESANNHRNGDHTAVLTTDHERYLESSNHVKRTMVHNHANTLVIMLVVIMLVVIAGFILFEERKMILKHSLSVKNGHHHAP
jgi:hypothetical protein